MSDEIVPDQAPMTEAAVVPVPAALPEPETPRPVLSVGEARDRLSQALVELDEALSIPNSIQRHPVRWAVGGVAAVTAVVGGIVWAFRTKR